MLTRFVIICLGFLLFNVRADGDDDSTQFKWDSSDEAAPQQYGGVIVAVHDRDGKAPKVTLGSKLDGYRRVYCYNFSSIFEASYYNKSEEMNPAYTEVANSRVNLADLNCNINQTSNVSFVIECQGVNGGVLTLEFVFGTQANNHLGLKYSAKIVDYEWVSSDANASLVFVQGLNDCSGEYSLSSSSSEDGDRRRLESAGSDSDSASSDSGFSSDDSDEYDRGAVEFVLDSTAIDMCNTTNRTLGTHLAYQKPANELHIVIDRFDCDMYLDPHITFDPSKFSGAVGKGYALSFVVVFVSLFTSFLF